MRSLLYWLSGRLPCCIISDGDKPYLERYYLFTALGVRFYLHRFVESDPDRGLHDHPWPWAFSIILAGSYEEHRRSGARTVRWFNWLTGDNFHRVVLHRYLNTNEPRHVWTMFAHRTRRTKEWGFLREEWDCLSPTYRRISYRPHKPGIEECWWRTVPRGRDEARRMPARGIRT